MCSPYAWRVGSERGGWSRKKNYGQGNGKKKAGSKTNGVLLNPSCGRRGGPDETSTQGKKESGEGTQLRSVPDPCKRLKSCGYGNLSMGATDG